MANILNKLRIYLNYVLFFTVTAFPDLAIAQTSYQGVAGGDWNLASNWTAGLPAAGNNALIPGGTSVTVSSSLTANFDIQSFGTIALTAPLTSNGVFENSGVITASGGGELTNGGTFNNFGNATFSGATFFTNLMGKMFNNGGTFTTSTTLSNQGDIVNNGTIEATAGTVISSGTMDNRQILNTRSLTVSPTGMLINNFGATINITGTSPVFNAVGSVTNNGNINNSGQITIRGLFQNNVSIENAVGSTVTVFPTGDLINQGTITVKGILNNNGKITNTGNLFNEGTANNNGTLLNNNRIENRVGATFVHSTVGNVAMELNFGAVLLNLGTFTANSPINSNGTLRNEGTFTNQNTITINSGAVLNNIANFTNDVAGTINALNAIVNDGTFTNRGAVNINSGSVLTNNMTFINTPSGKIKVEFEFRNTATATFTNIGTITNIVRMFLAGNTENNGYWLNIGDIFVETGGTLTNKNYVEQSAGNISIKGIFVNLAIWNNDECSTINNAGGTINNTGAIQIRGIVFQRGTYTGTAIQSDGGYIHTAATSNAPTICGTKNFGVDGQGTAKVYATELVLFENFDSCQNIIYRANGIARPTFPCSEVGTSKAINLRIYTRLGDSLTCMATANIRDVLAPDFQNCPSEQTIYTANESTTATWIPPTATDNCTAVTMTSSDVPGDIFPVGVVGVMYFATDGHDNSQECQFKINVVKIPQPNGTCTNDNTGPTITCPANVAISTYFDREKAIWNTPTVADNCLPLVLTSTKTSGVVFPAGVTTVIYTAKDGNGNTSTCSFSVTVTQINTCQTDTEKPVFSNCPSNIFSNSIAAIGGNFVRWSPPGAADNCTAAAITATAQPNSFFANGSHTVTYTATDAAGNTANCVFTIIVGTDPCPGDVAGPTVANCPANITRSTTTNSATATWTAPTFTDACSPIQVFQSHVSGAAFSLGATTVVYQASDSKGNKSTCSFTVTVSNPCVGDVIAPIVANCPANQTKVATTAAGATATWTAPTASDNCGSANIGSAFQSGSVFPIGITEVGYLATDAAGNTATCTFRIEIQGTPNSCTTNAAPINNSTNINPASVPLSWNAVVGATAYDVFLGTANPPATLLVANVGGTSTTATNLAQGTTYFWYVVPKNTAGSASGCQTTATNFQTSATGALTLNCPTNVTVTAAAGQTSAVATYTAPTGTSTCPLGTVTTTRTSGLASGAAFPVGTNTVIFTATDGCGNTQTCSFTVIVNAASTGVLTLNCPNNIVLTAAAGQTSVVATYTAPTGTSTCATGSLTTTRTSGLASGAAFPLGTNTVIFSTTDGCGNNRTCSFLVTVNSNQPFCSSITVTGGQGNLVAGGLSAPIVSVQVFTSGWSPVFNCFGANCSTPTLTVNNLASGGYIVKTDFYNANYGFICSDQKTATVATGGNQGVLTLNCPNNIVVTAATGASTAAVNYTTPTGTSTCTVGSVMTTRTSGLASGAAFPIGTNTVIYSASDGCGNNRTCSFTVTVNAAVPAVLTLNCPTNITVTAATGANTAVANYTTPTGTSTCTVGSVMTTRTSGLASGAAFPLGTNTVVYSASDGCGNNRTCSFTVTVNSAQPPIDCSALTFSGANNQITIGGLNALNVSVQVFTSSWTTIFSCWGGSCAKPTQVIPALATGSYIVKVDLYNANWAVICSDQRTISVTGGNSAVLTIQCPSNVTTTAATGATSATVNYNAPAASTTCNPSGISLTRTGGFASGSAFPIGTSQVNYQATDACGNVKTCSFLVTVNQAVTSNLIITCPANITVNAASGASSAIANYTAPTASSNCSSGNINLNRIVGPASGSSFPIGANTVTWQASDGCGNVKTCSFTVTVNQSGNQPSCAYVTITPGVGRLIFGNLTAPNASIQIFTSAWSPIYSCFGNSCSYPNLTVPSLPNGNYIVKFDLYNANFGLICSEQRTATVSSQRTLNPELDFAFTAIKKQNIAQLKWLNQNEGNSDYFILERSADDVDFSPIAKIEAEGAANKIQYFSETDLAPLNGQNYYRLRLVFNDGTEQFSAAQMLEFPLWQDFNIFPNPASDKLFILNPNGFLPNTEFILLNNLGKTVKTMSNAESVESIEMDLNEVPSGLYFLKLEGQGRSVVRKVVVE